jgi:hypothetical protein
MLNLFLRDDTLLIRVDPRDGSLHFDWRQGLNVFPSEVKIAVGCLALLSQGIGDAAILQKAGEG